MKIIQHIELSSSQGNITFNNIPQTYDDLLLVYSLRTSLTYFAAWYDDTSYRINGDTSNSYYHRFVQTRDGNISSGGGSLINNVLAPESSNSNATANTFGNGKSYIANYRSTGAKAIISEGTSQHQDNAKIILMAASAVYTGSSPVTSISLYSRNGSSFLQYSSATLYGISNGSLSSITVS